MESLGNKLKTAREEKGLTFDHVSQEINISSRYLEALEKEDFSGFPGEPYVLGFVKNYGEYLDLNPEELISLYRSLKIQEQPVPVEQLLKNPSPLPKILIAAAAIAAAAGLVFGAYSLISHFPPTPPSPPPVARTASEYTMTSDFLERRFYPGDSVVASDGSNSYKFVFANLGESVVINTPKGQLTLNLGQEMNVDLDSGGFMELKIAAADFVKNDIEAGALLRFEYVEKPRAASVPESQVPLETLSPGREASAVVFSSPNAYPFTLQATFQGYCLFRYEILFERDKPGRNEQYYQRSEEINIAAQNGIRLGISNAQAVKLQVIGGGRTVPLEIGSAGEVVAADLRWVRDEDNRYRLVLLRLE